MDRIILTVAGEPVVINLALVAYFKPDGAQTLIMFSTGLSMHVTESFDETMAILRDDRTRRDG